MNEEEIKKAIEVLKQPITVNYVDYHYFTQEQYDNLLRVYDNALWLSKIYEQVLEKYQQLKSTLEEIREYINAPWILTDYETGEQLHKAKQHLLQIIDKGKCENEVSDTQEKCDKGVNNE